MPIHDYRSEVIIRQSTLIVIGLLLTLMAPDLSSSQPSVPASSRARLAIARVSQDIKAELATMELEYGVPIFMRIFKQERILEIWVRQGSAYRLFQTYPVCNYGTGGLGPKTREGDGKAPEGFYFITPRSLNPVSAFHLSFNLGYPNRYDRYHGRTGSALMVHGGCASIGCYAMTNEGIERIYAMADAAFRNGQRFIRVHLFPFKMSTENMVKNQNVNLQRFWQNLKQGYDFFAAHGHVPPNVEVRRGDYVFNLPRNP